MTRKFYVIEVVICPRCEGMGHHKNHAKSDTFKCCECHGAGMVDKRVSLRDALAAISADALDALQAEVLGVSDE